MQKILTQCRNCHNTVLCLSQYVSMTCQENLQLKISLWIISASSLLFIYTPSMYLFQIPQNRTKSLFWSFIVQSPLVQGAGFSRDATVCSPICNICVTHFLPHQILSQLPPHNALPKDRKPQSIHLVEKALSSNRSRSRATGANSSQRVEPRIFSRILSLQFHSRFDISSLYYAPKILQTVRLYY